MRCIRTFIDKYYLTCCKSKLSSSKKRCLTSVVMLLVLTGCFVPLKEYKKKAHETRGLVKKVKVLQKKNKDLEDKIKILNKKYTGARKKLAKYDVSIKELEANLDEKERETETLRSNLTLEKESKYKEIVESKKFLEENDKKLREKIGNLLLAKKKAEAKIAELKDEKKRLVEELKRTIDELTFENQNLITVKLAQEKEIKDIMNRVSSLEKQLKRKIAEQRSMDSLYNPLKKKFAAEIEADDIQVRLKKGEIVINILTDALFDKNDIAALSREGKAIVKKIASFARSIKGKIAVEGHTDSRGIGSSLKDRFPSNWDLSSQRAVSVVRYLSEGLHVNPKMLSAVGHSSFKPVGDNNTEEGRRINRRIELIIRR